MQTCDIIEAVAPYAALIITHLSVVSIRQQSKNQGFDDWLRYEEITTRDRR